MACIVMRQCNLRLLKNLNKNGPIMTSVGLGLLQSVQICRPISMLTGCGLLQRLHKCGAISLSTGQTPLLSIDNNLILWDNAKLQTSCKKMNCCRYPQMHHTCSIGVRTLHSAFARCAETSHATGRAGQEEVRMPNHHADKLQLDFDDEDLAKLLADANNLVQKDSYKRAGVGGQEAEQKMENLVKYLCYCQCSPDNILHTLEGNPGILKIQWNSLQTLLLLLEEIGLRRGQLLKALSGHSALWTMDQKVIRKRLTKLRQIGFNQDLRKIVAKWPQVLTLSDNDLNSAVEALRDSDFSIEEMKVIIQDHPPVLSDTPEDIMHKFQYVHFCMGITEGKELVHGKIFRYSLDHIRCRHILLERMGIYKAPDKHKIDSAKNPKLQLIINTSDKRFCLKVAAGISEEDFEIFKRNLKEELKEAGLEGGERGSDSDYISDYDSDSNEDDSDLDYDSESSDEEKR